MTNRMNAMNRRCILDGLKTWVIPPGMWQVMRRLTKPSSDLNKPLLTSEEQELLERNTRFNGMYEGHRCFVIANGPSLKTLNLTPLVGEITIVMNWFNRHPVLNVWKPTVFCAADPVESFYKKDPGYLSRMLDGLCAQSYFLRTDVRPLFNKFTFDQFDRVYFVKNHGIVTPDSNVDLTKIIPWTPDTSVLAIIVAISLGCSPIYLLGMDFDWLGHHTYKNHFYDANDSADAREKWGERNYLQLIEWAKRILTSHDALREIARARGQHIYNATEDSFLDVYPRINFSAATDKVESGATSVNNGSNISVGYET